MTDQAAGSPAMVLLDVTGWCQRDRHGLCSGVLQMGTHPHWFCACDCHPEPDIGATAAAQRELDEAHATWKAARDANR